MKFPVVWIVGVALLIICQCSSPTNGDLAKPPQTQRKALDLKTPFEKINRKLQRFISSFNIQKILSLIDYILSNCLGTANSLQENLATEVYNRLMEHREQIETTFSNSTEGFCKSLPFRQIHNYMWVTDEKLTLHDLVKFFYNSGYPGIYQVLPLLYAQGDCPPEFTADLPKGPDDIPPRTPATSSKQSANVRGQVLSTQSRLEPFPFLNKFQDETSCNLLELLGLLQQTGLLDLLGFINTLIHEVIQKPSIHFLVGKIEEPAKGISFRGLRLLAGFQAISYQVDQELKVLLQAASLIDLLRDSTGIDLCAFNLIETVWSVLEMILWRNIEPVLPYVPTDPEPGVCPGY